MLMRSFGFVSFLGGRCTAKTAKCSRQRRIPSYSPATARRQPVRTHLNFVCLDWYCKLWYLQSRALYPVAVCSKSRTSLVASSADKSSVVSSWAVSRQVLDDRGVTRKFSVQAMQSA